MITTPDADRRIGNDPAERVRRRQVDTAMPYSRMNACTICSSRHARRSASARSAPWRAWRSGTRACCRWPPNPCSRTGIAAARRRGARPRWAFRWPFGPAPPPPPSEASRLLLNRCIFLGIPHHFRAGVLHLDFARDQADQRAARSPPACRSRSTRPAGTRTPESPRADCRRSCRRNSGTDLRSSRGADADFAGALPAGLIEALLGLERAQHLAVLA